MVGPVQLCTDGTFLDRSSVYLHFSSATNLPNITGKQKREAGQRLGRTGHERRRAKEFRLREHVVLTPSEKRCVSAGMWALTFCLGWITLPTAQR